MNHLNDEDLVLQYYGEPPLAEHLAACAECTQRFEELRRILNSVGELPVPERGPLYGAEVWRQLQPRLNARPTRVGNWKAWGAVAAIFALTVTGFVLGHSAAPKPSESGVRERILIVALSDHLERSQMVLAEIENAQPKRADLSYERSQAEDLLDANRLYRMTAVANGNFAAAGLLDDLERVLVDLAHVPEQASHEEIETLRGRIAEQGLQFKVKIFSAGMTNQ